MNIIEIMSTGDPRIAMFTSLTEAELRNRLDHESGIFIAESPKVINVALNAGYHPVAMLCEERHLKGDAHEIAVRCSGIPIYTGRRDILASITGYTLTRGVLCAMRRPSEHDVSEILRTAQRVVVIDGVCDSTNIGSIFRSAAALGIDAVLLTPTSCDPLNRRAIRVSMGSVFLIPWAKTEDYQNQLNTAGFKTVAMALTDNSISIDNPKLRAEPRLAIIMGTEGDGLSKEAIVGADYTVKIPMHHNVDSLNVSAAAAIALWELSKHTN